MKVHLKSRTAIAELNSWLAIECIQSGITHEADKRPPKALARWPRNDNIVHKILGK